MRYLLFVILFCALPFNSQAKKITLDVDFSMFRYDQDNVLLEMYYSFPDTMLRYIPKQSTYIGELYFSLAISNAIDTVSHLRWIVEHKVESEPEKFRQKLFGQKSIALPPGQYKIDLFVKDMNDTSTRARTELEIVAKKYSDDRIITSDLQIAQKIERIGEHTQQWGEAFKKNSLYVVPNPSLEYYGDEPSLKSYIEFYNAKKYTPSGITFNYRILDAARREIISIPRQVVPVSDAQIDINEIPLGELPSGVYYLELTARAADEAPIDSIVHTKRFYVYNPENAPNMNALYSEDELFEMSPFSTLSETRIQDEFEKAKMIASKDEIDKYEKLSTLAAKQRFIYTFWFLRDPDPSTIVNERYVEFQKAIEYAKTYFSFGSTKNGWRTDRGMILLKYGFPSERNPTHPRGTQKAYEEWVYENVQGGSRFYFVDESGFGNYILVHSTALGEVYNDNWFNDYVIGNESKYMNR
ncbi:MAG: GWxTD domain-containing protein [Candidatus Kapaibacterium sp.]